MSIDVPTDGAVDRSRVQSRRRAGRLTLPLAIVTAVLMAVFVVEPVTVGSDSMAPTLDPGSRVMLDKLTYQMRSPRRGELVAFHAPDTNVLVVKRVVGVGGDKVAIRDGVLWVGGDPVREPYVDPGDVDSVYFGPVRVDPGRVFLLGDNRGHSIDSRSFGSVAESEVVGRVLWRWDW